jgi:predicted DNA binding CopG/RHH family protein
MFDKVQQKLAMSKKKKDTSVLIRMTSELDDALSEQAKVIEVSKSALIRTVLETYVETARQRKLETPMHMRGKMLGLPYRN